MKDINTNSENAIRVNKLL